MHFEVATIASFWLSENGCGLPPPGSSFSQDCWADWNAGACWLIPETGEPGSGKFGTPCERMQSANLIASVSLLPVPAALLLPEDTTSGDRHRAAHGREQIGRASCSER